MGKIAARATSCVVYLDFKKRYGRDTEGVEQTTEGGMRRQIITAVAPPTPGRTTPHYLE